MERRCFGVAPPPPPSSSSSSSSAQNNNVSFTPNYPEEYDTITDYLNKNCIVRKGKQNEEEEEEGGYVSPTSSKFMSPRSECSPFHYNNYDYDNNNNKNNNNNNNDCYGYGSEDNNNNNNNDDYDDSSSSPYRDLSPSFTSASSKYISRHKLNEDEKIALNVQKRREFEEERKKRIFDPRQLKMGIDTDGLNSQIQQKDADTLNLKLQDQSYEQQLLLVNNMMQKEERNQNELRKERETQCKTFSLQNLSKEQRREYDLSDPNSKKNFQWINPNRPDLVGPASLLGMDGEDEKYDERKKSQQSQMNEWIQQQKFEKNIKNNQDKQNKNDWDKHLLTMDALAVAIENDKNEKMQEQRNSIQRENQQLAQRKRMEDGRKQHQEQKAESNEIYNNLTSLFLADGRMDLTGHLQFQAGKYAEGDMAVTGTMRDSYKGMSNQIKQNHLDGNAQICVDNKIQQNIQQHEEDRWSKQSESARRLSVQVERESQRRLKDANGRIADTNQLLKQQQTQQNNFLDRVLYRGKVGDAFFDNFGTTTR